MRVLIVEDERKISVPIKRGLEESGCFVDAIDTGQEGLDRFESTSRKLVVSKFYFPIGLHVLLTLQMLIVGRYFKILRQAHYEGCPLLGYAKGFDRSPVRADNFLRYG
jgi:CheY-like chemotaxis protein